MPRYKLHNIIFNKVLNHSALILVTAAFLFASCEKDSRNEKEITGEICFYLLKSYKTRDNSMEIITGSARIADKPIIGYKDITSYNTILNVYTISKDARDKVTSLTSSLTGQPFAVTIDKEIIYTGYFWPVTSPVDCDWIHIDPLFIDFWDGLKVMPADNSEQSNPANNPDLIKILRRDKKLAD
jgi:hypothetical protein